MTRYVVAVAFLLVLPLSSAFAQPGPNDVIVNWDASFPKKENGQLKLSGTTQFAGNWRSADGSVVITCTPTGGGATVIKILALAK